MRFLCVTLWILCVSVVKSRGKTLTTETRRFHREPRDDLVTLLDAFFSNLLVDKSLEPKFKHQQRPQPVCVVSPASDMLVDDPSDHFASKHPSAERFFRKQSFPQERLH